ncbi:unannotated protein [freshwater metagenome]|uniref:Unannotated protein n=1 Tax=freshwater metagenome TaxID=449393 RepID=A0A6J7IWX2_9ZZZZ|nr:hypothetical protein [Actinomycetota bacterium]
MNSKEQIYKIGKTMQLNSKRFAQYPKGSILLLQTVCLDCNICETQIIQLFTHKYTRRRDIGSEYFEGDYNGMIADIFGIVMYEHRVVREHVAAEVPVTDNYIEESIIMVEPVLDYFIEEPVIVDEPVIIEEQVIVEEHILDDPILCQDVKSIDGYYNCFKCKYKTFVKQNYSKHLISEKHIIILNSIEEFKNKCIKCHKIILAKTSLCRHIKNCKVIPQTYSIN